MNSDVIFTLTCIVLAVNLDAVSACACIDPTEAICRIVSEDAANFLQIGVRFMLEKLFLIPRCVWDVRAGV